MESKSLLFTSIPLVAIIIIFGYLNIQQESNSNSPEITSNELCKSIEYNGKDRIDILFISTEEEAKHYSEVLFDTEPYKKYRNYFNIYAITDQEVKCKDYKGIAILCNTLEIQNLAKQCPHDYITVVKKEPLNIRSSAYGAVLSINSAHEDSVLIHEIGHAYANLAEEYGGAKIPSGSKNCVSSCDKFTSPIDSCELECSESTYYRSIPAGVMRTLVTSNYGIYNIELITKLLEKNKPKDSTVTGMLISEEEQCDDELANIKIAPSSDDLTAETENILEKGCAPKKAGTGEICFNELCYSDSIFTDSQDTNKEDTLTGETIPYQEDTTFYVKKDLENPLVEVTHNGDLIKLIDTRQLGVTACKI